MPRIARPATAALRDFNLAFVRFGSKAPLAPPAAGRPISAVAPKADQAPHSPARVDDSPARPTAASPVARRPLMLNPPLCFGFVHLVRGGSDALFCFSRGAGCRFDFCFSCCAGTELPPQCDPSKHADLAIGHHSGRHECNRDTPLWPPHHLHRRQTGLYWKPLVYLGLGPSSTIRSL